jgi:hypothetical protein
MQDQAHFDYMGRNNAVTTWALQQGTNFHKCMNLKNKFQQYTMFKTFYRSILLPATNGFRGKGIDVANSAPSGRFVALKNSNFFMLVNRHMKNLIVHVEAQ